MKKNKKQSNIGRVFGVIFSIVMIAATMYLLFNIIKLNVLEGKKYQEIAEELGITVNTIRTQVSRGYKKLRDILSGVVDSSVLFFMFLKNK